jgi:hypothetical protein
MNGKLLLKCPKCGNKMLYQARERVLSGKKKTCVYCGSSFSVSGHIIATEGSKKPFKYPKN